MIIYRPFYRASTICCMLSTDHSCLCIVNLSLNHCLTLSSSLLQAMCFCCCCYKKGVWRNKIVALPRKNTVWMNSSGNRNIWIGFMTPPPHLLVCLVGFCLSNCLLCRHVTIFDDFFFGVLFSCFTLSRGQFLQPLWFIKSLYEWYSPIQNSSLDTFEPKIGPLFQS